MMIQNLKRKIKKRKPKENHELKKEYQRKVNQGKKPFFN